MTPHFFLVRFQLVFACLFLGIAGTKQGHIKDVLTHYEMLHVDDISHGVSRRDVSDEGFTKSVFFEALGRKFQLHLAPNNGLFSKNFHAYLVGDKKEEIPVDKSSFYRGYMEGEQDSMVNLHLDHGLLTGTISTKEDTYVVEPSWRHLNDSDKEQMIAYRRSDVLFKLGPKHIDPGTGKEYSFCGHDSHHPEQRYNNKSIPYRRSSRGRRETGSLPTHIRCGLAIVADHHFYREMGKNDRDNTVNYMIGVIDRVDQIFQRTLWGDNYKNFGFQIERVIVHEEPSSKADYNSIKTTPGGTVVPWPVKDLLETFSKKDWYSFCLAHLFTYQDFDKGVIGLAYVGSPESNKVGGICTEKYTSGGTTLYLNTGLSSSLNWGRRLLTEEADIVTAHELGHNFGSEHDPETDSCAPHDSDGGKYIMYPASVSGKYGNNKLFSPCTKRRIFQVLKSKSPICFEEPQGAMCGNYKKENGEECDPGELAAKDTECCTTKCKLKPGKSCSDGYDEPCCRNCTFVHNRAVVCRERDIVTCRAVTYCNNKTEECPASPPMPDGSPCIENGECQNGKCVEFCVIKGLESCQCSKKEEACKICCQDHGNSKSCKPYIRNSTTINLRNGRPCVQGSCVSGDCVASSQDVVERFWNFLTTLDIDKVKEFMKDNLAGTILVFSLIIWIPGACIVHRIDKRHDKEEAEYVKWRDPKNKELLRTGRQSSRGSFVYRQDSISRSSKPDRPLKYKPRHVKTRRPPPKMEFTMTNHESTL